MKITKNKLPKGLSYPLSSELLKEALETQEVTTPTTLNYSADSQLLVARYYVRRPWEDMERLIISSGAVDSSDSEAARKYIVKSVVPDFVAWAVELVKLPANSSKFTGHQFLQWVCPENEFNKIATVSVKHVIADKFQ